MRSRTSRRWRLTFSWTPLQQDMIVASLRVVECLDNLDPHDRGAVDPHEALWVELLLQRLQRLADHVADRSHVQLGLSPAHRDVVDPGYRHDPHLASQLHRDPLEVLRWWWLWRRSSGQGS
jgi:hypothetical protein